MTYLAESLKGHYENSAEDRLSQIFSATFNSSRLFRRAIAKFGELKPYSLDGATASTQQQFTSGNQVSKIDVLVVSSNLKPLVVLENKIEAPLTPNQLRQYNGIRSLLPARKIALVRNHFPFPLVTQWTVRRWSDLYSHLCSDFDHKADERDSFVFHNFISHLKELGMYRASQIRREGLRQLAKAITAIRRPGDAEPFPLSRFEAFKVANDYIGMLEELTGMVKDDERFGTLFGKGIRFAPYIANWWKDIDGKEKDVWIGVEWEFRHPRNGYNAAGTGLWIDTSKGTLEVASYVQGSKNGKFKDKRHDKPDLGFDKYARDSLAFWLKQLQPRGSR